MMCLTFLPSVQKSSMIVQAHYFCSGLSQDSTHQVLVGQSNQILPDFSVKRGGKPGVAKAKHSWPKSPLTVSSVVLASYLASLVVTTSDSVKFYLQTIF